MTLNRMGSSRPKNNRKAWLVGTVTLGALATSGGVATAALAHTSDHRKPVSQPYDSDKDSRDDDRDHKDRDKRGNGLVCLRLDEKARTAIHDAEAAAKDKDSVVVPMDKVEVVPCPDTAPKPSDPAKPVPTQTGAPKPTQTSAPKPTQTSAPKPTQTSAPKPTQTSAPKPTVTSTAS